VLFKHLECILEGDRLRSSWFLSCSLGRATGDHFRAWYS